MTSKLTEVVNVSMLVYVKGTPSDISNILNPLNLLPQRLVVLKVFNSRKRFVIPSVRHEQEAPTLKSPMKKKFFFSEPLDVRVTSPPFYHLSCQATDGTARK